MLLTRADMKSSLLAFASLVAACSGSGDGSLVGPFGKDGGVQSVGDAGDGGVVIDNGGSVEFAVSQAFLVRGEWCGTPPPFTKQDAYDLVLYGAPATAPMPWPTVQISVWATVAVGVPVPLTLVPWKPGPAPAPGNNDVNDEEASAEVNRNPVLGFGLARGMTIALPDPNPYDQATMTVLAIPQKEGDTLQVRVQLHFTDGGTLDETFVSPTLDEMDTPCGGRAVATGRARPRLP